MSKTAEPSQKVLNAWATSLIVWSVYRATFGTGLPIWLDEFIAKPLVFLLPAYWFISRYEKKPFTDGVGLRSPKLISDILVGLSVGGMFVVLAILTRIARGLPFTFSFSADGIVWVMAMVAAAASEQILSTGFVFKRLLDEGKGVFQPIIVSALLFSFLHIPALFGVEKIAGSTLIQMLILNCFLSITTSFVYVLRKNSIAPIIVHALYFLSLPIML